MTRKFRLLRQRAINVRLRKSDIDGRLPGCCANHSELFDRHLELLCNLTIGSEDWEPSGTDICLQAQVESLLDRIEWAHQSMALNPRVLVVDPNEAINFLSV